MIQLYFLSILCNGVAGYVLFAGSEEASEERNLRLSINNPTFILILGILSAVVGLLKLLSPVRIPILGDLVPALAGLIAGFILVFGIYRLNTPVDSEAQRNLNEVSTNLLRLRKTIGLGLMVVALLHFLFPDALFL